MPLYILILKIFVIQSVYFQLPNMMNLTKASRPVSRGQRILLRSICFLFCILGIREGVQGAGFLQVRNFTHEAYQGGPQNWAFAQDSLGRVYIGNRDGMLSFDGERWHKFGLPNSTTVRSLLYVPSENRIYAGGTDEFGYFEATRENGTLRFRSLKGTLPKTAVSYTEVWHIHRTGRNTVFQTDNHLFIYDGRQTTVVRSPERLSTSAIVDGHLYVGTENGTILELSDRSLVPVPGTEAVRGMRIQTILDGYGHFLVATPLNGLFVYRENKLVELETDITPFLKENQLFCGATDGRMFVFGTVSKGAVVKDFANGTTRYVNRESGMLNNTVLNAAFDMSGNIWLGLDNGLDYAFVNWPASTLVGQANDIGAGYTSLRHGDRFYMGTNQGLYSTSYPFASGASPIRVKKELQGQIWSVSETGGGFFVAGDGGIYIYEGGAFHKISGLGGGYRVRPFPGDPERALAACYDGFHLLRREGGVWRSVAALEGDHGVHGDFIADRYGNIWVNYWLKGLYRLVPDPSGERFSAVLLYNSDKGLPSVNGNSILTYKGDVVVATPEGIYSWDRTRDRFVRHPQLNSILKPGKSATLHGSDDGALALMDRTGLNISMGGKAGSMAVSNVPLRGYRSNILRGYEHINVLSPAEVLLGTQNGFWLIEPMPANGSGDKIRPFVNMIVANMDSLVYRAPMAPGNMALKLSYGLRSLRFELGFPDFVAPEEIQFSTFLENYEKSWGPYSQDPVREYTKLSEGNYILHIRARNVNTDKTEEAEFRFSIAPPWYRTLAAKLVYIVLALGGVCCLLWMIYRWKLRAEQEMERQKEKELDALRQRSEQEALQKDYEIASLKSEQLEKDIRHKSGELSTATMNLIRKNEILTNLASRISKIQGSEKIDPGVRRQLEQLQTSIRENISHDDVWTDFSRNFDIVYNNYTQRLHDTYPALTAADIRICCYIRMGLASKDIAPLLNITVKSVEMARYRLRKKMNIAPDVSLTDLLTSF